MSRRHHASSGIPMSQTTNLSNCSKPERFLDPFNASEETTSQTSLLRNASPNDLHDVRLKDSRAVVAERAGMTAQSHQHFTAQQQTVRARIGIEAAVILGLSAVVLLITVIFLSFLWWSPRQNRAWLYIVTRDWTAEATTLTTTALRQSITFSAAVITPMLAVVILESRGIRLENLAELSIARCVNVGSVKLGWTLFREERVQGDLILPSVAALLFLTTFAAQFSSTLLISDLGSKEIIRPLSTVDVPYGFTTDGRRNPSLAFNVDYWTFPPSQFLAFAEYSNASLKRPAGTIDDTGPVIRAFLPLPNQSQRRSIRQYTGPGYPYDARVVCVQPILSNLSYAMKSGSEHLSGQVVPAAGMPELVQTSTPVTFECLIDPPGLGALMGDVFAVLCFLSDSVGNNTSAAGGLIPSLDHSINTSLSFEWNASNSSWMARDGNNTWVAGLGGASLTYHAAFGLGLWTKRYAAVFCPVCISPDPSRADIVQTMMFNDIIRNTGSPALALQAQFTTVLRSAYYQWISLADASSPVSMSLFETKIAPTSHRGYWAVIAIVVVHSCLAVAIVVAFAVRTEYSSLNSPWQVIAQMMGSPETSGVLKHVSEKTEENVRQHLRTTQKDKCMVTLGDPSGSGKVVVVKSENGCVRVRKQGGE
ncbi:hypothetical protein NA57DRAFT_56368 [Rhizodiscina lignyota]|uniref:Uncharacterized protein n=1 Tax=Rhizodiscina lignyota TaxID=1504668 RepID=A0A9P4IFJ1_9PEZI|nr:hypothetical protein NA57DRAFT_56368 [Rhizodiscina lignyota]